MTMDSVKVNWISVFDLVQTTFKYVIEAHHIASKRQRTALTVLYLEYGSL